MSHPEGVLEALNGGDSARRAHSDWVWVAISLLVFAVGAAMRLYPSAAFEGIGFDENLYRVYVNQLKQGGVWNYPHMVQSYLDYQRTLSSSLLPPLRFLYIYTSYLWSVVSGAEAIPSLHAVACGFSILTLPVSFFFSLRLSGKWAATAVLALMSFAPTQLHMSQHALIDGFFAFWALLALWLLWENLQAPNRTALLLAYVAALALMTLTKENAFFVFVAICTVLLANRWCGFGRVTPRLLLCTLAGPGLAVLGLVVLAGGVFQVIATYEQLVTKSFTLPYAIKTGDGPWYRYLVDLMLMSPLILLLAIGQIFQLDRSKRPLVFVACFIAGSYVLMCNVRYGMNLRYTNMWDMPLRLLAFTQLSVIAANFGRSKELFLILAVAALCLFDLRQYSVFFVQNPIYELVSEGLLRAVRILK
jgi:4-amino-4-deoxy-L-arabinose transferase-like glycosyltransferase